MFLKVTSSVSLTATRNLIYPAGRFPVTIENLTTGGQGIQVIGPTGTGVNIANGQTMSVWNDGTNFVQVGVTGAGTGNTTSTGLTSNLLPKANGTTSIVNSKFSDDGTNGVYGGTNFSAPILKAIGGTPGIVTPTLQLSSVTIPGCAALDAVGNLSSTGTACAATAGVTGLNTLTGPVVLAAGSNVALTTVGNQITINGLVNAPTQTEYTPGGGGRALSTVYQNLTNRLILVTVFFLNSNTTDYGTAFGYTDATATPSQYGGGCTAVAASGGLNTPCSFTMAILPNNYYEVKIFGGFGAYFTWFESQP